MRGVGFLATLEERTTPPTSLTQDATLPGDELFMKLPLGAGNLAGELTQTGTLTVQTTLSGQLRLHGLYPGQVPSQGGCSQAIHLVEAVSIGSFRLQSGGAHQAGASADADLRWEVRRNQRTLCTTPCSLGVDPTVTMRLRAYGHEGPSEHGEVLDVPDLRSLSEFGEVRLEATPSHR